MKKHLFFTLLLAAAVAFSTVFGCKKSTESAPSGPDTFFVKMNQTVPFPAGGFTIRLDSVIGESRCPANAECFWEGRVDARFVFTKNAVSASDTLAIGAAVASWPDNRTEQFGFGIQMIDLSPYPQDGSPIPQAEYVARLVVLPQ